MSEGRIQPSAAAATRMSRRIAVIVALFAVLIAVVAVWSTRNVERNALLEMPEQARRALYERTLETLQTDCGPAKRPKGLDAYCAEQAVFIQQFPECDQACQELIRPYQKEPTR